MHAIEVINLRKKYGLLTAVNDVSFHVGAGEIFGFLGPNGAGKTTTVEILVGLRRRDAGRVAILGLDPEHHRQELRRRVGVQLQNVALYPRLRVRETALLFGSFYQAPLPPSEVLSRLGLDGQLATETRRLSGGQRQRLAVALAVLGNGDLIFLDEPTTGLDPQARRNLWELIIELKRRGKTVFLTTHYLDEAERLCDRVAILDQGRIIALDTPQNLINRYSGECAVEFEAAAHMADDDLSGLAGVSRWQRNDELVTLYTSNVGETIDALMAHAGQRGQSINDLKVRQATLEDVFLEITGRRMSA